MRTGVFTGRQRRRWPVRNPTLKSRTRDDCKTWPSKYRSPTPRATLTGPVTSHSRRRDREWTTSRLGDGPTPWRWVRDTPVQGVWSTRREADLHEYILGRGVDYLTRGPSRRVCGWRRRTPEPPGGTWHQRQSTRSYKTQVKTEQTLLVKHGGKTIER